MRTAMLGTVLIVAIGLAAPGYGQWIRHPTEGVPRNADGTPNLKAAAPRLPDGKPDFSGDLEVDTELIDEFCLEDEKSYERMQRSRGK